MAGLTDEMNTTLVFHFTFCASTFERNILGFFYNLLLHYVFWVRYPDNQSKAATEWERFNVNNAFCVAPNAISVSFSWKCTTAVKLAPTKTFVFFSLFAKWFGLVLINSIWRPAAMQHFALGCCITGSRCEVRSNWISCKSSQLNQINLCSTWSKPFSPILKEFAHAKLI